MYSKQFIMLSLTLIQSYDMKYACHIWGQVQSKTFSFNMIQHAQNKALKIKVSNSMEPSEPLYNQLKINSLKNNILNNCLFVFDNQTNNLQRPIFLMFLTSFSNLLTLKELLLID